MKDITIHLIESIKKPIFRGNLKQSPYKAVDLGLSVKWCSCNVGSEKPEDPGLLFQWGKTEGYKYGDENHKFLPMHDYVTSLGTKYKPDEVLKPEDDAAHVNMKGDWRMPTKEEIDELKKLKHKWTELNGVKGYEIIGENENSIFMPVTGCFNGILEEFLDEKTHGNIWSSSVRSGGAIDAYYLYLAHRDFFQTNFYSCSGFSVRGVCE